MLNIEQIRFLRGGRICLGLSQDLVTQRLNLVFSNSNKSEEWWSLNRDLLLSWFQTFLECWYIPCLRAPILLSVYQATIPSNLGAQQPNKMAVIFKGCGLVFTFTNQNYFTSLTVFFFIKRAINRIKVIPKKQALPSSAAYFTTNKKSNP